MRISGRLPPCSSSGERGKGVQSIGVQHHGAMRAFHHAVHELRHSRALRQAWTNGQHVAGLGQFEAVRRIARATLWETASPSGSVINSGANPATVGSTEAGLATVASPAPMRRAAMPHMAAAPLLPSEPADDEHVSKAALVAIQRARGEQSGDLLRSHGVEILRGDNRGLRGSDGRDFDGAAGQRSEHVSRFGSREGNHGAGAADQGCEVSARAGGCIGIPPEGRSTESTGAEDRIDRSDGGSPPIPARARHLGAACIRCRKSRR